MLQRLFGNRTAEQVLLYLFAHEEGYGAAMAAALGLRLSVVQKQLARLEEGGVLASSTVGRTRLYRLNPLWPFTRDLKPLLGHALEFLPPAERAPFEPRRTRPRAAGKR